MVRYRNPDLKRFKEIFGLELFWNTTITRHNAITNGGNVMISRGSLKREENIGEIQKMLRNEEGGGYRGCRNR